MREILITFLGTSFYQLTSYDVGQGKTVETRFVQEAIYNKIGNKNLKVYVCLTDKAIKENWHKKTRINRETKEEESYEGLKKILDSLDVDYTELPIRDGKNEDEIWENFSIISNIIKENDTVHLDITHSFRSIPIMMMSILNYAKFIKDIKVGGILYGSFEAKDDEGVAPIFDISLFDTITDWAIGVDGFITSGDARRLEKVISRTRGDIFKNKSGDEDLAKNMGDIGKGLQDFTDEIYSVRGLKLGGTARQIYKNIAGLEYGDENKFKPFEEINDRVEAMFSGFSDSLVINIHESTKLCLEFNLVQQGLTLLEENITNFLIELQLGSSDFEKNILDIGIRNKMDSQLLVLTDKNIKSTGYNPLSMEYDLAKDLSQVFRDIKNTRNDLNHAGFNGGPINFQKSMDSLKEYIEKFESLIIDSFYMDGKIRRLDHEDNRLGSKSERKMGLIFSHKLTEAQIKDAEKSLGVREFKYMPDNLRDIWSSIPEDLEDIKSILRPIEGWILDNFLEGDYILVQGDFGATYRMVNFIKDRYMIPVYSTSSRDSKDIHMEDGRVKSERVFSHKLYREY